MPENFTLSLPRAHNILTSAFGALRKPSEKLLSNAERFTSQWEMYKAEYESVSEM